jgi:hypothetical protein
MKLLALLPLHGTQSKDFLYVKLMYYTVVSQIFVSKSICFLYRCLVMTVKSVSSTFVLCSKGERKYAGSVVL